MHLAFLFTQTLQPEEKKTKQPVGDCVISLGGPLSSLGLQPADQGHLKDFFFSNEKNRLDCFQIKCHQRDVRPDCKTVSLFIVCPALPRSGPITSISLHFNFLKKKKFKF